MTLQLNFFVKLKSETVFGVKIQRQFTILIINWQFLGKKVEVHQKVDFLSKRIERKEVKQSQKFTHWGNVIQLIFQWQQKRELRKLVCGLFCLLLNRKSIKKPFHNKRLCVGLFSMLSWFCSMNFLFFLKKK